MKFLKSKRRALSALVVIAIGAAVAACGGGGGLLVTSGLVIRDATIVDTRDGSLVTGKTVIVDAGKIVNITDQAVGVSGTAQAVEASGQFLVPGYLDMHAHVMDAIDQDPNYWPLLIASGVTGVREMSGSPTMLARVRQLNLDIAAGKVEAPEIVMAHGGTFVGAPVTDAAARTFVQQQKALGSDFVKLLAGAPPFVFGALDEARKQGLTVAGHLPTAVSALAVSNAGWSAVEHLGAGWGLLMDCATNEAALRLLPAFAPPFPPLFIVNPRLYDINQNAPIYQGILDSFSDSKCQTLAQAFVANDTWQIPTLIRLRTQNFSDAAVFRNDPNLKYVDKARRAQWAQLAVAYETTVVGPAPAKAQTLRDFYARELAVTKLLKQAGVKMMTGSDSAPIAIWTIPGISLHQEFAELAAAGLSPLEILQMATLNGAQFLKREATMGTVAAGKKADLVLLEANPITDAANLSKIAAVVMKGKHYDKAALEKLKADVAAAYAAQPAPAAAAAMAVAAGAHVH